MRSQATELRSHQLPHELPGGTSSPRVAASTLAAVVPRRRVAKPTIATLTIEYGRAWEHRAVARQENIAARLKRLRLQRGLSQRQLSSPGVSYAYISRIEARARLPSVKALRQLAGKLGVTVEHLETGTPTALELGVADAGVDFGSLTLKELQTVQAGVDQATREAAKRAAENVLENRRQDEVAKLRKRLDELAG
jgi:transcriptional regulator with XRE-family HTH domain